MLFFFITKLAFLLYLVTGYLSVFLGQWLNWIIEESLTSLSLISRKPSFIARFPISFCHPLALHLQIQSDVGWCGLQIIGKRQTSLFWREGALCALSGALEWGPIFCYCTLAVNIFVIWNLLPSGTSPHCRQLHNKYSGNRPPLCICTVFQSFWSTNCISFDPHSCLVRNHDFLDDLSESHKG